MFYLCLDCRCVVFMSTSCMYCVGKWRILQVFEGIVLVVFWLVFFCVYCFKSVVAVVWYSLLCLMCFGVAVCSFCVWFEFSFGRLWVGLCVYRKPGHCHGICHGKGKCFFWGVVVLICFFWQCFVVVWWLGCIQWHADDCWWHKVSIISFFLWQQ